MNTVTNYRQQSKVIVSRSPSVKTNSQRHRIFPSQKFRQNCFFFKRHILFFLQSLVRLKQIRAKDKKHIVRVSSEI